MRCSISAYLTLILVLLVPIFGSAELDFEDPDDIASIDNDADDGGALCRITRNARNSLLMKAGNSGSDPKFTNCVVSDSCTSLICSTKAKEPIEQFGWHLRLCDALGSKIDFILKSSTSNSSMLYTAYPTPQRTVQRTKVSLNTGIKEYYLNVTFLRWYSKQHPSNEKWSTLSLDVLLDICNGTCESVNILTGFQFPLMQLCQNSELEEAPIMNLVRSNPKAVQIPESFTSHKGMPCNIEYPFMCGKNSVCRYHKGGRSNEGICDCCDDCELSKDGSCVIRTKTTTEEPSSATHEPESDASVVNGFGAFFAIFFLFFLGGGIFYGVKYNMFSRAHNRLRLYWASHCNRRVISVADQGHMFNPIYDDDDPPLL